MSNNGTAIYCDCCEDGRHQEKMAVIYPQGKLEILDRRHGITHTASVGPVEILERLAGTYGRDAIMEYVRGVL